MDKSKKKEFYTSLSLSKKQLCFIESLVKSARFTGRKKFSKTSIIKAIVNTAQKLNPDVSGVRTEKELKERFLEAFRASE